MSNDSPVSAMGAADLSPFEGRMSLNALIEHRVRHDSNFDILSVAAVEDPYEWRHITFGELDQLVTAATAHYARSMAPRRRKDPLKTVAVVAASSLDFFVTELALLRMGYAAALLSPNNSVPALVHLIKATDAGLVIYSLDKEGSVRDAYQELLSDPQSPRSVVVLPQFSTQDALKAGEIPARSNSPDPNQSEWSYSSQEKEKAIILHSSGSTGYPKPLTYTHAEYLLLIADDWPFDAMCTVPLFHGYGSADIWRQILIRRKMFLFSETLRMDLLKPAILRSDANIFHAVPFTYKMIAEADGGIELLRRFEVCAYSGAPCPQEVGDSLVAAGINLVGLLGSTEAGVMMESFRDYEADKNWNVYRPTVRFAPHAVFENTTNEDIGPYELVIHDGWKSLIKHNRPDNSYATGDLFELIRDSHRQPRGYSYVGRGDDTLVHSSGEKTNPVPMEQTLRASPLLRNCLIFGSARNNTGALIVPYEEIWRSHDHLSEKERQSALKKEIGPALQEVNRQAPSHSRLVPEMIRFLPPHTVFPLADKGSVKRVAANATFATEMEEVYSDFDLGLSTSDEDKIVIKTFGQVKQELQGILESLLLLDRPLDENEDLTKLGADSLMDAQIRSKINRTFKLEVVMPSSIIFKHPTLARLAKVVFNTSQIDDGSMLKDDAHKEQEKTTMSMYLSLKAQLLPRLANASSGNSGREVVVLTGATGSLGAHILAQLAAKSAVSAIFCLNRAKSDLDAHLRTESSLRDRHLPSVEQLQQAHGHLVITSLASDFTKPDFGLTPDLYQEILTSVTSVVHNGWPVNFNMAVESFQDALNGALHLVNLAGQSTASTHPRFLFSSSIAVALKSSHAVIEEMIDPDMSSVVNMGYAQSKWIVEQLCRDARDMIGGGLDTVVMRIGQMVGDRAHGIWNESEAQPLLLKSAQTIGLVPDLGDALYWMPVDCAASIVARLTSLPLSHPIGTSSTSLLVHVTNEASLPYAEILETLAKPKLLGPSFKIVPESEWIHKLESSDPNPARNPTIKLLKYFQNSFREKQQGKHFKGVFSTVRLRSLFESAGLGVEIHKYLAAYKPEYLAKTVAAWKTSGFLD